MLNTKYTKRDLPINANVCSKNCIYSEKGVCGEPQINHGNSDASCHTMTYKEVLALLGKIKC